MKSHNYTQFIMKVINKAIEITGEVDPKDTRGRTLFEKYSEFC